MNICLISPEFVTESDKFDGGLSNYIYRLSLSLIFQNHKPLVIVYSDKNEIFEYEKIQVHRINIKTKLLEYPQRIIWQAYKVYEYINSIKKKFKIDIIQYASYLSVGLFPLNDIPSVIRISSYQPLINKYYNQKPNKLLINAELAAIKAVNKCFAPSNLIIKTLKDKENIDVELIETPFILETSKWDYSIANQIPDKPFFLFFGSLGILKGVDTIAKILKQLFETYPDYNFVFVGKDMGYKNITMLDFLIENTGKYQEKIIYFNKTKHKYLYPIINKANLVILPSRIDNFPNTCIESLSLGKIVIGTKNTGFDQLISHDETGFLCERDNPEDLLNTINCALSISDEKKQIISENAKKRISKLAPEYIIPKLINLYSETIKEFNKQNKEVKNTDYYLIAKEYNKLTEKIKNQNNELIKQKQLIDLIYKSKSYRIGNKIVNIFKFGK